MFRASVRLQSRRFAARRSTLLNSFASLASGMLLPRRATTLTRETRAHWGPRTRRALLLGIAVFLVAAIAVFAQAQKRSITEKDIFQFNWIGDPQISPDGERVAFVKVTVDDKKTGYDTAIWSVATRGDEAPRRMTDGKHDSSPRWSPDGKWLVFVRSTEPAGAVAAGGAGARPGGSQLYMLPLRGGGES